MMRFVPHHILWLRCVATASFALEFDQGQFSRAIDRGWRISKSRALQLDGKINKNRICLLSAMKIIALDAQGGNVVCLNLSGEKHDASR